MRLSDSLGIMAGYSVFKAILQDWHVKNPRQRNHLGVLIQFTANAIDTKPGMGLFRGKEPSGRRLVTSFFVSIMGAPVILSDRPDKRSASSM